jgi:phage shock protein B
MDWSAVIVLPCIFIGMPWVILHYITQWKKSTSMTNEDEALLDQMYETARRLEERLMTVERIVAADNPDFRALRHVGSDDYRLEGRN